MPDPSAGTLESRSLPKGDVTALFLYRHVLERGIGDLGEIIRARKPKRLPVVMTREETKAVLGHLQGDKWLMASLLYGAGLRLMECLRLRVQDLDFARNEITVRDGKGAQDRITMLPNRLWRRFANTSRRSRHFTSKTSPTGGAESRCRTPSTANTRTRLRTGAGSGCSHKRTVGKTPRLASKDATMCTRPSFSGPSKKRVAKPTWLSTWAVTRSGIPSRRICSRAATTSGPSRSCLATRTSARRWSTLMSSTKEAEACGAPSTSCESSYTACISRRPPRGKRERFYDILSP